MRAFASGGAWRRYLGIDVVSVFGQRKVHDLAELITHNINDDARRFLRKDTRFWLQGASPDFSDPVEGGARRPNHRHDTRRRGSGAPFRGPGPSPPLQSHRPPPVPYRLSFDGDVGQLKKDARVKLRGFTVGKVENFWLEYNAASDRLETPVIIGLEPTCFALSGLQAAGGNQPALNRVLDNLAKHGMRAKLVQSPPLIGSYQIALDFVPDAPKEGLDTSGAIASVLNAPGGGLDSIVHRVNQVPIDRIAAHVLAITTQVQSFVSSPQLQDSLKHLDRSLIELDSTIQSTGPQITDLVNTLRKTGDELDEGSLAANPVLGRSPTNQDKNVKATLYELTEAARSVRMLADYLDRHSEAILKGKPSQ